MCPNNTGNLLSQLFRLGIPVFVPASDQVLAPLLPDGCLHMAHCKSGEPAQRIAIQVDEGRIIDHKTLPEMLQGIILIQHPGMLKCIGVGHKLQQVGGILVQIPFQVG